MKNEKLYSEQLIKKKQARKKNYKMPNFVPEPEPSKPIPLSLVATTVNKYHRQFPYAYQTW